MTEAAAPTGLRLSPQQRRLWRRLGEGAPAARLELELTGAAGEPGARLLEQALGRLVARHEALRTRFQRLPGLDLPVQVVTAAEPVRLGGPGGAGGGLAASLAGGGDGAPRLRLELPALAVDRESLGLVAAELAAALAGAPPATADDEVLQYGHFGEWQEDLLAEADGEEARRRWAALVEAGEAPELPFAGAGPAAGEGTGDDGGRRDRYRSRVPLAGADSARAAAAGPAALLAAWRVLLARLSGGAPGGSFTIEVREPGREHPLLAGVVGPVARWLPVPGEVVPERPVEELVEAEAAALERAREDQEYFAADLGAADLGAADLGAAGEADAGGGPAGQAAPGGPGRGAGFAWYRLPSLAAGGGAGLKIVSLDAPDPMPGLCLEVGEELEVEDGLATEGGAGGGLTLHVSGDPGRYAAADLQRTAGQFALLLAAALAGPRRAAGDLPLLTEEERRELVERPNQTHREWDDGRLLPALLTARAAERGAAPAVIHPDPAGEERLSFAELEAGATALARRLRAAGVGPEVPVALYLGRCAAFPLAVHGVWKAGGAFVPLDPDDPAARTAGLLRDLAHLAAGHGPDAPRVVVTRSALAGRLDEALDGAGWGGGVTVIDADGLDAGCLDAEAPGGEGAGGPLPAPGISAASLAYVLYTSGSTGRPKGVMVSHGSLANLLPALDEAVYGIPGRALRIGVNAPFVFDGSIKQVVRLAAGDTLWIVPEETRRSGPALLELVAAAGLDALDLTPGQLRILLDSGWEERPGDGPARVLVGGEALDGDTWHRLAGDPRSGYHNVYGPTETTVDATTAPVDGAGPRLGAPLANVRVYVTDAALRPQPTWLGGELVIGGDGVSRGYLGLPARTAASFVPDPFSGRPGARLYRSGDRARWRPGAGGPVLDYLGRLDQQVQLRGVRLEPGEVEAVLAALPGVRQAAVEVREETAGDQRLVAWYVATASAGGGDAPSRGELRRLLPETLVPSLLLPVASLPLTRSGKLDRRALAARPLPEVESEVERDAAGAAPNEPVGEVMSTLWCDVLDRPHATPADDFFELGGHSLLATRLVLRARQALGVEVPVRLVFEHPTLGDLSRQVRELVRRGAGLTVPPVEPRGGDRPAPLSFSQQRLWFLHQMDPRDASYNSPAGVRFEGALDVAALAGAFAAIVRRHQVLRTSYEAPGGRPVQRVGTEVPPLRLVDLAVLPAARREAEASRLAAADARRPFDLGRGPVLRTTLFRLAPEDHAVQATLHHITSDAWSRGILIRELSALYAAFAAGEGPGLPELPVQYADYAAWQRDWFRGEVEESHARFWRRHLAGAPPVLELPADHPRPARPSFRGERLNFLLPDEVAAGVRRLARRGGATTFMVLLAAFNVLLGRLADREDVVVGTDVAGRSRPEVEPLIGFFINQLVLRTDLSGNPTFRELLARVRETTLAAYAYQEMPFDRLVEELQPPRDPSRNPIYQVLFVLQNTPKESLSMDRLILRPFGAETASAKFDLALFMGESGERMGGAWEYTTDLFTADTVRRFSDRFQNLLRRIVDDPDARLASLSTTGGAEAAAEEPGAPRRQEKTPMKFKKIKPKAVTLPQEDMVEMEPLEGAPSQPLMVTPRMADVDLADWARGNRDLVEEKLRRHGGLLLRGFDVRSVDDFQRFGEAVSDELFAEYGDLPREEEAGKVYSSTPYPEDKAILFHNESSHLDRWPRKIMFLCVKPAEEGGETPIADCRRVYEILSPQTRRTFEEKGLTYLRNYTDSLDVSWQRFFGTEDRSEVEAACRESGTECEWLPDGGLRTRQRVEAVREHPETGEKLFFNQVQLHHISFLDAETRESLLSLFGPEGLPRNVHYGDGTPIPDAVMGEVTAAYEEAAAVFGWQPMDVVLLDNMMMAHSRNPFRGERKIVVALGDLYQPATAAVTS